MPRYFSTSAAKAVERWLGYSLEDLTPAWRWAALKFTAPGGSAEQKLGKIEEATIKSRAEGPVHKSHFNRADKEDVLSIRIKGELGTKTCHVYADGTGTTKQSGDRT